MPGCWIPSQTGKPPTHAGSATCGGGWVGTLNDVLQRRARCLYVLVVETRTDDDSTSYTYLQLRTISSLHHRRISNCRQGGIATPPRSAQLILLHPADFCNERPSSTELLGDGTHVTKARVNVGGHECKRSVGNGGGGGQFGHGDVVHEVKMRGSGGADGGAGNVMPLRSPVLVDLEWRSEHRFGLQPHLD